MKFRKKKPTIPKFNAADITSRIRGFILDSQVKEADHITEILGCPPISDEVADKEVDESDARMTRIQHLIPLLYMYAKTMSDGVVDHQRIHAEHELDDEVFDEIDAAAWGATRQAFSTITLNTLMGAISQLVDMGYLQTGKPNKWRIR